MIGGIFLFNYKGDIVTDHIYRHDITRVHADIFRVNVIHSRHAIKSPIIAISGVNYCFVKKLSHWLVAITAENSNVAVIFQFLHNIFGILQQCLHPLTVEKIGTKVHFISNILSEVGDNGVPQMTDSNSLMSLLNYSNMKIASKTAQSQLTVQVTGQIGWRKNDIVHKKNELFLDIKEQIHCLMASNGDVLTNHIIGSVQMKSTLSGMPECSLGINDKLITNPTQSARGSARNKKMVAIDDCTFHQCVKLSKFESEQSITFIPPDESFELMNYRTTKDIILPFKVTPIYRVVGPNKTEYTLVLTSTFPNNNYASKIFLTLPLSKWTVNVQMKMTKGSAKYKRGDNVILWKIRKMLGMQEIQLVALVTTMDNISRAKGKEGSKNISLEFKIEHAFSGLMVRYLRIIETRLNYSDQDVCKWVRYLSVNGLYESRVPS